MSERKPDDAPVTWGELRLAVGGIVDFATSLSGWQVKALSPAVSQEEADKYYQEVQDKLQALLNTFNFVESPRGD